VINLLHLLHRLPRTLSDLSGRLSAVELRLAALERPPVAPAPQPTPKPKPDREPGDCWTCANANGSECLVVDKHPDVDPWAGAHTEADFMTRLPGSPPCPAWRAK
jgi:hypothetical protein